MRKRLNITMLLAAASVGAGIFLRVHGVGDQIPLDDEWHGMFVAATRGLGYIATHFEVTGTSIPYTLYRRLCLLTVGWDEVILRLPSLIAGCAALMVFPLFARRLFKDRAAALFSFLLAVSPMLIYFSRYSRAYSVIALLQFIAVLSFYFWLTGGGRRHAAVFVVCMALAVWFHVFAGVTLAACFLFACVMVSPLARFVCPADRRGAAVSPREVLLVFGAAGLLSAAFYLPAMWNGSLFVFSSLRLKAGVPGLAAFLSAARLMSGTSETPAFVLTVLLAGTGFWVVRRTQPVLASLILCLALCAAGAFFVSWAQGMTGFSMARYAIVLLPFFLLLAALGLECVMQAVGANVRRIGATLSGLTAVGILGYLCLAGPLLPVYARVNNFTNHNAYQQDYAAAWEQAPYRDAWFPLPLEPERIPGFYGRLAAEPGAGRILEYPMMIGGYLNFHEYYQRLHRREIVGGYLPRERRPGAGSPSMLNALDMIDRVFGAVPDRGRLRFGTLLDMRDIDGIGRRRVRYVILHGDPVWEGYGAAGGPVLSADPAFTRLTDLYRRTFGDPVYADAMITVFKVPETGGQDELSP
ncbi:MAG: ArnT family glycosyltransferase [Deltaproteobacteria bacterium]